MRTGTLIGCLTVCSCLGAVWAGELARAEEEVKGPRLLLAGAPVGVATAGQDDAEESEPQQLPTLPEFPALVAPAGPREGEEADVPNVESPAGPTDDVAPENAAPQLRLVPPGQSIEEPADPMLKLRLPGATPEPQEPAEPGRLPGQEEPAETPMPLDPMPPGTEPLDTEPAEPGRLPEQEEPGEAPMPGETEPVEVEPPRPLLPLSPELAALRDPVRRTLSAYFRLPMNTRDNSVAEIMSFCLAFNCHAEVSQGSPTGPKLNGITCLCWNYPCAGRTPLVVADGRIAAKVGYGLQEYPSQLLAVLALSRVPADYPLRVGETVRTVADLVEHEKLACRPGTDLSLKLVALAYYLDDETWENDLGEAWSLQRIIEAELDAPILGAPNGGIHRLMGLSAAVTSCQLRQQPLTGQYARAEKFLSDFQAYAFSLQNADGSWSSSYFAAGQETKRVGHMGATAQILAWLAMSLPQEQLEGPQVARAVVFVNRQLQQYQRSVSRVTAGSPRQLGYWMYGLNALMTYDSRVFKPRDPDPATVAPVESARRPATRR